MVARMHLLLKADGNQGLSLAPASRARPSMASNSPSGSVPSLRDELQTVLKNLDTGRPEGTAMAFMSTRPSRG